MAANIEALCNQAMEAGGGILRLAPNWVPRSFLHPGRRIKLHPRDYYALGTHRGGIDERWFASTTEAANDNREEFEGLSFAVCNGEKFLLRDAVDTLKGRLVGDAIWNKYQRWPVYSKFFDNMGPIPHHMHQREEDAKLVGQEGKPEAYYFPPQLNYVGNNFPYTFFGLEPGTTKQDIIQCLERWNEGDNGILDYSKAYRLKVGSGWKVDPGVLHAPGSLVTYEPQWGSDVFGMYQSLVEGRRVPWELLVKDMPKEKHHDLEFIVNQLDWEKNVDPNFGANHALEPIADPANTGDGYVDNWVVYGGFDGFQVTTAKELTIQPKVKVTIKDNGASGVIVMQGRGRIGKLNVETPALIRFGQMTEDEVFISAEAAKAGVEIENHSEADPLVLLRYFGPEVNPQAPEVGDHKK
ncbi:MAG: hypothetical protein RBU29_13270 [bacterium]|jgi:hypothetical protein|nr:hypothetical protein [bacterium]